MPRVGDGTGFSQGSIPTHDGLTWREDKPENPSGEYASTPKGKGAVKVDSRTSRLGGKGDK